MPFHYRMISLVLLVLLVAGLAGGIPVQAAPADQLRVELHHYLLQPGGQGRLLVREQVVLNNSGAAMPAGKVVLYLPEDIQNLSLQGDSANTLEVKDGNLVVKKEVPSGRNSYGFSYEVLSGGAPHFLLKQKSDYATDVIFILAPPEGVTVSADVADLVQDLGNTTFDGQNFHLYNAENIASGQEVNMVVGVGTASAASNGAVSRNPPPAFHNPGHIRLWYQSPFSGMNAHLFLALVLGIPLAGLVYYLVQRKKPAQVAATGPADQEEEVFQRLRTREKILLNKMKELEKQRSVGAVDEDTYQKLREAYKKKLVQVKLQLRQFAG